MPPPASHRLAILLVPPEGGGVADGFAAWEAAGFVARDPRGWGEGVQVGLPGRRPLVEGGFGLVRAVTFDGERILANRQGGFRVACPVDGRSVVPAFNRALMNWRAGGPRSLGCPCGATHDLAALVYRPEAVFSSSVLEVLDAHGAEIVEDAVALLREAWAGAPRVVLRRG